MLLYERIESIDEALTPKEIRDVLLFTVSCGALVLLQKWLGASDCKDKNKAKEKIESDAKAKAVFATFEKIQKSHPKLNYTRDCDLIEYLEMGIFTTSDIKKYISRFKKEVDNDTTDTLNSILKDGEDNKSYDKLTSMKGLHILSDGGGTEYFISPNNKIFEWDHEGHTLKDVGTYEDYIVSQIDYIYDSFSYKKILVKTGKEV